MSRIPVLVAALICVACLAVKTSAQTNGSVERQVLSAPSNLPVDAALTTATART